MGQGASESISCRTEPPQGIVTSSLISAILFSPPAAIHLIAPGRIGSDRYIPDQCRDRAGDTALRFDLERFIGRAPPLAWVWST